jgi:AcrR family transcriptional regulator
MNERLQEYVDSRGLSIGTDRQRGIIRGVKILGVRSQNGRTYLAEAIGEAVPLYEGAKVNVNHSQAGPAGPRDYQDRIGVICNVTAREEEGLFGDFHFNPKHVLAELLLWDAENAPQNVGFSHNVQARTSRQGDTVVVEAITSVQSVDLVADPATTRGLFESTEAGHDPHESSSNQSDAPLLPTLTVEQLCEARPDLIEALLDEPQKRIEQLLEEVEQLRSAEKTREKREVLRRLLAEYELPCDDGADRWQRRVVSEAFLETLMQAEDETAMRQLIRERVELVRDAAARSAANHSGPVSREQTHVYTQQPGDVEAFVRSIS